GGTCQDLLFDTQEFCAANGGMYFGPGGLVDNPNADGSTPNGAWFDCCHVLSPNDAEDFPDEYPLPNGLGLPVDAQGRRPSLSPTEQRAAYNGDFKLIERVFPDCSLPLTADDIMEKIDNSKVFPPYQSITAHSFYLLDTPEMIDKIPEEICRLTDVALLEQEPEPLLCRNEAGTDNCANAPACLTVPVLIPGADSQPSQTLRNNYDALLGTLHGVEESKLECLGDGNLDKRVTQLDVDGVDAFRGFGKSYYDFNRDGFTGPIDREIALANLGTDCLDACYPAGSCGERVACRRADLNQDNLVNKKDVKILNQSRGPCDVDLASEAHLCNADLNGDGLINNRDLRLLNDWRTRLDGQACPITVHAVTEVDVDCEDCTPEKQAEKEREAIVGANVQNIQGALDEGVLLGNGRVRLVGEFDLGGGYCNGCIRIRGPVIVQGTGDPSGDATPKKRDVTIINAGNPDEKNISLTPFTIDWDIDYFDTPLIVEKLWFNGGFPSAIIMEQTRGTVKLLNNRVTGLSQIGEVSDNPDALFPFRFGMAGAGFGPLSGQFHGKFHAVGNYIHNPIRNFSQGDDNGVAISATNFDFVEISHNTLITRGEAVEIENNIAPGGRIEVIGNKIRTNAAISNFAKWTFMPPPETGWPYPTGESGGHPACIKVTGGDVAQLIVEDNDVETSNYPSVVCIMVGLSNDDSRTVIRNNRCSMDGSFAGILAGWAGEIPFFPPFFLHNALVEKNVFEGTPRFGIIFTDWTFDGPGPNDANALINTGNHNLFRWNDMSRLHATDASLVFWDHTSENVFFGNPNGTVINTGTNNVIKRRSPGPPESWWWYLWWLLGGD
ncbi:MAG: hypothetical protein WBG86_19315, partial [Polyangiales bacterium]